MFSETVKIKYSCIAGVKYKFVNKNCLGNVNPYFWVIWFSIVQTKLQRNASVLPLLVLNSEPVLWYTTTSNMAPWTRSRRPYLGTGFESTWISYLKPAKRPGQLARGNYATKSSSAGWIHSSKQRQPSQWLTNPMLDNLDTSPWHALLIRTQLWQRRSTLCKKHRLFQVLKFTAKKATTMEIHAQINTNFPLQRSKQKENVEWVAFNCVDEWHSVQKEGLTQLSHRAPKSFKVQLRIFKSRGLSQDL